MSTSSLAGEAQTDIYGLLGYLIGILGGAFLVIMLILSWIRRATGSKQEGSPVSIVLDSSNPGRYYMELYEQ
jgi:preprotein translocase subunit SecG